MSGKRFSGVMNQDSTYIYQSGGRVWVWHIPEDYLFSRMHCA